MLFVPLYLSHKAITLNRKAVFAVCPGTAPMSDDRLGVRCGVWQRSQNSFSRRACFFDFLFEIVVFRENG